MPSSEQAVAAPPQLSVAQPRLLLAVLQAAALPHFSTSGFVRGGLKKPAMPSWMSSQGAEAGEGRDCIEGANISIKEP